MKERAQAGPRLGFCAGAVREIGCRRGKRRGKRLKFPGPTPRINRYIEPTAAHATGRRGQRNSGPDEAFEAKPEHEDDNADRDREIAEQSDFDCPDGAIERTLPVPTAQVTKCAFGGSDLTTLFITTAGIGRDPAIDPMAGHVFAVETGIRGQKAHLARV